MIFTLCGPVGAGKSVVAQMLVDKLLQKKTVYRHPSAKGGIAKAWRVWRASGRLRRMLKSHGVDYWVLEWRSLRDYSLKRRLRLAWGAWRGGSRVFMTTVQEQEEVFSLVQLTGHDAPVKMVERNGADAWWNARCGVFFADELQNIMGARDYNLLPPEAKVLLTRHRHFDLDIVATTQHMSFADKIARVLTGEVWLVRMVSLPLIGALNPRCVRPPDWCGCDKGKLWPHVRRDAKGDWSSGWRRRLRFGTFFIWSKWSPVVITNNETTDSADLKAMGHVPRGLGMMWFDMKWAGRSRGTVHKELI